MGEVFFTEHERYGTGAAVKVLTPEHARRERFVRAFREEVRALAKLDHPGIAAVYDHGVVDDRGAEVADPGAPWIAMEYIRGPELSEASGIGWWSVLEPLLLSLLDALAHAHAHNVVHRDLKPGNVMLVDGAGPEVGIRLLDFGVARVLDEQFESDRVESEKREVRGTPKYMAPEQILGLWRNQGPWTDLYAFGCLAWQLVTGRAPFAEETTEKVLERQIEAHPESFDPVMEIPDGFRGWLERLMAKRPAERFRRAADAACGLVRLTEDWTPDEDRTAGNDRPVVGADGRLGAERYPTLAGVEPTVVETTTSKPPRNVSPPGTPHPSPANLSEASDAQLPGVASSAIEPEAPPVSSDWRRAHREDDGRLREGASLGLFGLRKIPMVDREPERDQLWRLLRESRREASPRAILLTGPAASGKSRLAEWLVRRSHELGAATTLRATHSATSEWSDGLGPMLARHFRCFHLDWDEALERVQDQLAALEVGEMARVHDAVGLTYLMGHRPDQRAANFPGGFDTDRERNAAVRRVVEGLGRERGVVVWLDDAVWGPESLKFARSLFREGQRGDLRVLVVMTSRTSDLEAADEGRELIDGMLSRDHLEKLEIDPLSGADHRRLVERMLALRADLSVDVARHTEGDPLFATQLLRDWVDRDLLRSGEKGYELRSEEGDSSERPRFPDDLDALWDQRLQAAFESLDGADIDECFRAVEIAAVLGRRIDREEWNAACAVAEIAECDGIENAMLERGLAESADDGGCFFHSKLVSSLRQRARDQGRWADHNRRCAQALARVLPRRRDALLRRAEHLLEAGDREAALDPLYDAAVNCGATGRYREDNRLLEKRAALMDELGIPEDDRRRVQNRIGIASNLKHLGEAERAKEYLREAEDYCRENGWEAGLAEVLRILGSLYAEGGDPDVGVELIEEAPELYRKAGDEQGRWEAEATLGWVLRQAGENDAAQERIRRAVEQFETFEGEARAVKPKNWLATTYLATREYDKAIEILDDVHEEIRGAGLRFAEVQEWNLRGEIARFRGDWRRAKRAYERARELAVQSGQRSLAIIELNLAQVDMADGRYRRAEREFERAGEGLEEAGLAGRLPRVRIGLAACAAGREDWEAFDRRLEDVEEKAVGEGVRSYDDPWLAEFVAELAEEGGEMARARRAWTLVANLWGQAGHPEKASEALDRATPSTG